jgi:hypothetical protein
VPEGVLEVLRELERADEEIGAELAGLERLAGEVESVRGKAEELETFAARLPAARKARADELERARAEAAAAQRVLDEAEERVRTARPEDAQDAERFLVRARDHASVGERRLEEAGASARDLEDRVGEAAIQGHEVHTRARRLAAELRGRPRIAENAGKEPDAGLAGVEAWSGVARAALFVGRGQLAAERDGIIRQANELGAAALGEPLTSLGTGALARRVERGLAPDT